jgi:protocatechuate 3,4-dioxygenase, alpha subunit
MSAPQRLIATSSQTVGPFFHFGLATSDALGVIAAPEVAGERIELRVKVLDGAGAPVPDALIELYQADAGGEYPPPGGENVHRFHGFGRLPTLADGGCVFSTIKPGPVRSGSTAQAPHINVCLLSRGLLRQVYTRLYFRGDTALASDPVLAVVPAERRETLLARPVADQPGAWDFVIRLQGQDETVFFDL